MLSDTEFYFVGTYTSPIYNLQMYKITFGNTTPDWANKIQCSLSLCGANSADSIKSLDGTKIYCIFTYGNPFYIYFVTLRIITGSPIESRYKSNISWIDVYISSLNGDYLLFIVSCYATYIGLFNTVNSTFIIREYSSILYGSSVDFKGR